MTIKYPEMDFPPPNMKSLIDRTAAMLARNEPVMGVPPNKSNFNFLTPSDRYFPYFLMKVEQFEKEFYSSDESVMSEDDSDDEEMNSDEINSDEIISDDESDYDFTDDDSTDDYPEDDDSDNHQ